MYFFLSAKGKNGNKLFFKEGYLNHDGLKMYFKSLFRDLRRNTQPISVTDLIGQNELITKTKLSPFSCLFWAKDNYLYLLNHAFSSPLVSCLYISSLSSGHKCKFQHPFFTHELLNLAQYFNLKTLISISLRYGCTEEIWRKLLTI